MTGVTLGEIFMAAMSKERLIKTFLDYARVVNTNGASEPVAGEDTTSGELLMSFNEIGARVERHPALSEHKLIKPILDFTSPDMKEPQTIARAVRDLKII